MLNASIISSYLVYSSSETQRFCC